MMTVKTGRFLFFLILTSVFFSCSDKWQVVDGKESGFSFELPDKAVCLGSGQGPAAGRQSWSLSEGILTRSIEPHAAVEATDEALQLLINSYLKSRLTEGEGETSLISFREINLTGAVGAEIIMKITQDGKISYGRLLIADNRNYQFSLSYIKRDLATLENGDAERIFNSIKWNLQTEPE